jgi:hypothetical protein
MKRFNRTVSLLGAMALTVSLAGADVKDVRLGVKGAT